MCQITLIAILLLAGLSLVSAKCDMMKEFKPSIEEVMGWAKGKCGPEGSKTDLQAPDIEKLKNCFVDNISPMLKSECAKKVDTFMHKNLFDNPNFNRCCHDKKVQDDIKKDAIKCIGMKCGMGMKKECEGDCPNWKTALSGFAVSYVI